MCRLLALVGRNPGSLLGYLDSLVEVSRCDPLLAELRGSSGCEGHSDGWGYAVVGVRGDGRALSAHYRTTLPVYEDSEGLGSLKDLARGVGAGVLIAHSRRLAEGSARTWNTHPMHYGWRGFEMWIAHNGLVNSEGLSRELGVGKLSDTTDTYYLGEYVYRRLSGVDGGELVNALRGAARYTKTAMNTLVVLYDDRRLLVAVTSYVSRERVQNPLAVEYYRLFAGGSNGSRAFFSSSIARRLGSAEELPLQTAVLVEVDLKSGRTVQGVFSLE